MRHWVGRKTARARASFIITHPETLLCRACCTNGERGRPTLNIRLARVIAIELLSVRVRNRAGEFRHPPPAYCRDYGNGQSFYIPPPHPHHRK